MSTNNYSELSESHIKDNKYNTNRNPYFDFKSDSTQGFNYNAQTPINTNTHYNIPHKNKYLHNIKGYLFKENTVRLTKNKSNFSCIAYNNHNTISNSHSQHTPYTLITRRQNSHANLNSKEDIANKINTHLEEKFADFSDKLGKNINDNLLKPSIEKLKKNMKKKLKQVKNSLKKAEISQRPKRKENNS